MSILVALTLLAQTAMPPVEEPVAPYTHSDSNAGAQPIAGKSTWRAFHEQPGVDRIVEGLVARNHSDRRISDIFRAEDPVRLRRLLKEQFCYILNGGCPYSGRTMHDVHRNMGLQQADLGALVENLQAAMRAEKVPFAAQNRLLAKLAPMQRIVVER